MNNVNRLIYPGFWFGKTDKKDALEMARRGAGGFCIYGGTREGVRDLIAALRAASPLKKLFICADYEDGLGRWISGEKWVLSNLAVGASGQEEIAYQKGLTLAREAKKMDVDWVFAPVLDLCDEPNNPIVNTRSFGADPQTVARLGAALCRGLKDGGVLNSLKHFPGHGKTTQDSHLGLPVLNRTQKDLENHELIPFRAVLPYADSVMIGHLLLPDLDPHHPASLSRPVITELLQNEMGYRGLVFTDALCMKAIGDEKEAALAALDAGAHILLAAENSIALSDFLQTQSIPPEKIARSCALQDALSKQLEKTPQIGMAAQEFNTRYAADCTVQTGQIPVLTPGQTVAYLELSNEETFVAQPFLNTLKSAGLQMIGPAEQADTLIAVSFSNYKAFKGHINLSEEEKQKLARAAEQHEQSVFVSFGSPFGSDEIRELTGRLFLFSPADEAQICAADILLGKTKAKGVLPV